MGQINTELGQINTLTSNGYYISSDDLSNDILANDNFKDNVYITI